MTFTIPEGSPKAAKAAEFGRELVRACQARDVSFNELERVAGVGHTTLDSYRRGLILPRTEPALALAEALQWPKLAELIRRFRTFPCARKGCPKTFTNDGGNQKAYCSEMCRRIAENVRMASRRARQASHTGSGRRAAQEIQLLKSGLRIADERNVMLVQAIEAMCHGCEPEGACRTADCPLRPFSPLPLSSREIGQPRTVAQARSESWTPERRANHSQHSTRRWSREGERDRQSAGTRAWHESLTPEERAEFARKVSEGRRNAPTKARVPWTEERRARHLAGVRAAAERRREPQAVAS